MKEPIIKGDDRLGKDNKWLKNAVISNKFKIFFNLLINIFYSMLIVNIPILIKNFIDEGTSSRISEKVLIINAIIFIILSIMKYIFSVLMTYSTHNLGWNISESIRNSFILGIANYDRGFFQSQGTGKLTDYINKDINNLNLFFKSTLIPIFINLISFIYILVNMSKTNLKLTLLFLIYFIFAIIFLYRLQAKNNIAIENERKIEADINQNIDEIIGARKEIKLMKNSKFFLKSLEELIDKSLPIKIKSTKFLYGIWVISLLIISFSDIFALAIGGSLYFKGIISLGYVYLLYSYSKMIKEPLENMQYHLSNILVSKKSFDRLNEVFNYKNRVSDGSMELKDKAIDIKVKGLSFKYDRSEKNVLDNISFEVKPNDIVGIVGFSGAGKSTLIKILLKQLEIENKKIYIQNKDINDLSIRTVQDNIGLFTITDSIYDGSLIDNLTLFNENLSIEEVANRLEKYNFLDKFRTEKTESSKDILQKVISPKDISSGELQLINLFRLLFIDKKLVIFDEAMSNLSEDIESYYFDIINELSTNMNFILITHNVERLLKCNKIIILDNGRLVEENKPEELLKDKKSIFYKMSRKEWDYEV